MSAPEQDTFNDFDPNGGNLVLWAVWDGREFYCRPRRGGVITRFGRSGRAKLYRLTDEGWVEVAVKDLHRKNDTCDNCGLVGVEAAWNGTVTYPIWNIIARAWCWERKGRKIADSLRLWFLCPGCKHRTGWY